MTSKQFARMWVARRNELLKQLQRLDQRKEEGWEFRKVYRKPTVIETHKRRGHYAMVPVRRRP